MTAPGALTDRDVVAVRAESAAHRPVTVWFTPAAVGVPAGGSAKVVAVGDADEGDFIQVRPAGSRDTMFCSPNELTRTRPARRRAVPEAEKTGQGAEKAGPGAEKTDQGAEKAGPGGDRSGPGGDKGGAGVEKTGSAGARTRRATTPPTTQAAVPPATESARRKAAPPAQKSAPLAAPSPGSPAAKTAAPPAPAEPAPTDTPRPARAAGTRRRTDDSAGMSVSLTASAAGEWTVEVLVGKKRVVPPTSVDVADVATVARALPPVVAEAVESSLENARQRQRERVERLRAELDVAQRALDKLDV